MRALDKAGAFLEFATERTDDEHRFVLHEHGVGLEVILAVVVPGFAPEAGVDSPGEAVAPEFLGFDEKVREEIGGFAGAGKGLSKDGARPWRGIAHGLEGALGRAPQDEHVQVVKDVRKHF